ncbi:putative transposase element L1Md-A101/L1Md-A102/L1Md-A2 [Labeo rohita]|uniref:Putative transposase element L1Md-A101/L1Md-A102/L1Md-A2 n=1 Tax=Labeo rohita TaxID=84645 RepID=A0A498N0X8_LABRO|nr:putative transposase element L1Md-A101/L1Md-A102/L1Md-A2 [Labeo rohita]RXN22427.1 putative transposase element L1Md-A101/L1Md-A102/L1Md-A2 [Labeo rohita]
MPVKAKLSLMLQNAFFHGFVLCDNGGYKVIGQITWFATEDKNKVQKIGDVETALTDCDARLITVEKLCNALQTENRDLKLKLDDLENRSRRQNVRIIGIPEGSEGHNPVTFVSSMLTELFGEDAFERPPEIDRAHRVGQKPQRNSFPRHMVVRLHKYQTKELILKLSRERGQLEFNGTVVRIFPDMSAEVMRRRAEYKDVKTSLRNAGITYGMLYPARLRVDFQGQRHMFLTPQTAAEFIRSVVKPATSQA